MAKTLPSLLENIQKNLSELHAHLLAYKGKEAALLRLSREKTPLRLTRLISKLTSAQTYCQSQNLPPLLADLDQLTDDVLLLKERFRLSRLQKKALADVEYHALNLVILKDELQEEMGGLSLQKVVDPLKKKLADSFSALEKNLGRLQQVFSKDARFVALIDHFLRSEAVTKSRLLGKITSADEAGLIQQFSSLSQQMKSINFHFLAEHSQFKGIDSYQNLLINWNNIINLLGEALKRIYREKINPQGILLGFRSQGLEGLELRA